MAATLKNIARRLLIIGGNRLELLTVELQEDRERLLRAFLLAVGAAVFALLAGMALTAAIAVLLWAYSPLAACLVPAGLYGVAAALLFRRLIELLRGWRTLPASLDQLRKDRECLEKILG